MSSSTDKVRALTKAEAGSSRPGTGPSPVADQAQPAASRQRVVLPDPAEIASQVERAYPGYHVWVSDEGWWYASRVHSRARGQSRKVHGASPDELTCELSAEQAAATRAHQDAISKP